MLPDGDRSGLALFTDGDEARLISPELWLLEAMAQAAGAAVFRSGEQGRLAGVDRYEIEKVPSVGDSIELKVGRINQLGPLFRAEVEACETNRRVAVARLYLAKPDGE